MQFRESVKRHARKRMMLNVIIHVLWSQEYAGHQSRIRSASLPITTRATFDGKVFSDATDAHYQNQRREKRNYPVEDQSSATTGTHQSADHNDVKGKPYANERFAGNPCC